MTHPAPNFTLYRSAILVGEVVLIWLVDEDQCQAVHNRKGDGPSIWPPLGDTAKSASNWHIAILADRSILGISAHQMNVLVPASQIDARLPARAIARHLHRCLTVCDDLHHALQMFVEWAIAPEVYE